ncbi:hypothetical protein ACFWFI_31295 [Streptomyces sp. NPDC060209]|uniref:hypothetical protein n=1 Tax=Streptomyces sp. NPDC060209 TaxID=3347073 RepID=UPI00364A6D08
MTGRFAALLGAPPLVSAGREQSGQVAWIHPVSRSTPLGLCIPSPPNPAPQVRAH